MKPLNSQDQEYVITLSSTPTNPLQITISYNALLRTEKENKNMINGTALEKATSAEEQLIGPPDENTEVSRHIQSIVIYNPTGNGTITVDIDYKDNFPSTPTLCRVQKESLGPDSFMRYSKEIGWT